MNWSESHKQSEQLASQAESAMRVGDHDRALDLYAQAADAEETALSLVDQGKPRTLGISCVSAISLRYKAHQFDKAESTAYRCLAIAGLPEFATEQLRSLLQSIWSEMVRQKAGVRFATGQVTVSVKGGQIVEGGAPLDLIVEKVQTVQNLFYRTAELLRGLPHRKRGGPTQEIQETCRPWLFQTVPGSYQFAVAVQDVRQTDLFKTDEPVAKDIASRFMGILRASIEDPEGALIELVRDEDYRGTFLKLARNLAPTGKTFSQMEIRSTDESHAITLVPDVRKAIAQTIRSSSPQQITSDKLAEENLRGILRAVHLDQDWLEVTIGSDHVKVINVSEAVDDIIGPMVNKQVLVRVARDQKGKLLFRDIEPDD